MKCVSFSWSQKIYKLTLLYILPEYLPDSGGGIITFYGQLLPALVQAGHEVRVLVANHQSLDKPACVINGVQVEYLASKFSDNARLGCRKFKNPTLWAFLPLAWGAFEQTSGGEGHDLVEATDWGLLYMPWVVSERKAKVVVSLHGSNGQVDWYSNPDQRRSFDGGLVRLLEAETMRLADRIHANSRMNASFWSDRTGCEVQVIPPVFHAKTAVASFSKRKTGLVAGRLQYLKGAEVLCQALREVEGIYLEWIGRDTPWESGSEMASSYLAKKYPDIFGKSLCWTAAMPHNDVLQKIANASFLLVASVWEVFNLTVLEAMVSGTPVICSRNAGAEMMIEDGVSGFLFDPEKPGDLAVKLKSVFELSPEKRKSLTNQAKANIKMISLDVVINLLLNSYLETISSGCRSKPDSWLSLFFALDFKSEDAQFSSFPHYVVSKIERLFAPIRP